MQNHPNLAEHSRDNQDKHQAAKVEAEQHQAAQAVEDRYNG